MDDYSADRWNRALDRDAERNKEYGRQESEKEIAHLRARIAALEEALKSTARLGGKRIAELEAELSEAKNNSKMWEERFDRAEDLRVHIRKEARRGHYITEERIDAAWGDPVELHHGDERYIKASDLGIVACPKCGGGGEIQEGVGYASSDGGEDWRVIPCPACHRNGKSHGWVWKETTDV